LQCVAVCCSVLQCVAVCCSVLQSLGSLYLSLSISFSFSLSWEYDILSRRDPSCVAVCCSVLQCVAVCCSVLQCIAICCSALQPLGSLFLEKNRHILSHQCKIHKYVQLDTNMHLDKEDLQKTTSACNTLHHTAPTLATHQCLPHTATHCNMRQHPATHCNMRQHPATHCTTL